MAAIDAYTNFAYSKVFAAPSPPASGSTIMLAAGTAARLPAVPFNASVWPATDYPDPANAEIVRVIAIVGDALTIARAQEGTSPRTILVGDAFAATITKKTLDDLRDASNLNAGTIPPERLGVGVPSLTADNHWTGRQFYDGQGTLYTDPAAAVGQRAFREQHLTGHLQFDSINEGNGAPVGTPPLRIKWGGGVYVDQLFVSGKRAVDLETIYPIGSVYMNATTEANPATYFGFGTWVPFGQGRAIVCYDASQAEFNAAEKVGGEKAHTTTAPEMPYHTHVQDAHVHSVYDPGHAHTVSDPTHTHGVNDPTHAHNTSAAAGSGNKIQSSFITDTAGGGYDGAFQTFASPTNIAIDGAYTGVAVAAAATGVAVYASTPTNQYAGGNVPHNNLQPFITCFVWKRTA